MPDNVRGMVDDLFDDIEQTSLSQQPEVKEIIYILRDKYQNGDFDKNYFVLERLLTSLYAMGQVGATSKSLEELKLKINGDIEITPLLENDSDIQEGNQDFVYDGMMNAYMNEISKIDLTDTKKSIKQLLEIRQIYQKFPYRSQIFEQSMCEVGYRIVCRQLKNRENSEETLNFINEMDLEKDFKIFLKGKIGEIIKKSSKDISLNDMVYLVERFTGKEKIDFSDISLWEKIAELDEDIGYHPQKQSKEKQEKQTSSEVKTKSNVAGNQEQQEDGLEVLKIRYNPKDPEGINRKDLKRVIKKLYQSDMSKKYRIVYEEGITVIPDLRV